jgi:hypothetical protein
VTKGVAAGAALLAPFGAALGLPEFNARWLPEVLALAFSMFTVALLIEDLARPHLFFRLLTRPNTRSWLVKGGWVLGAFGALTALILGLRLAGAEQAADHLRWPNALLGLATAGYTALLFRQCEGRDLWQGPLLLPHLLVQALLCGAAALVPFASRPAALAVLLLAAVLVHAMLAMAERRMAHPTDNARQAAAFLGSIAVHGIPRAFTSSLAVGALLPAALVLGWSSAGLPASALTGAALLAFGGLYLYEAAFVRAGQLPPLS